MIKEQLKRLSIGTAVYGIGQILNRFIGFLLLPLFTAYLSPVDYGVLAILGLITFMATSFFSLGIGGAAGVCYFDGNNRERKEETIWTSVFLLAGSTVFLAIFGVLFSRQISYVAFQKTDYSRLVMMTLFSSGATILASPFMLFLQFEEKAKTFVALTIVSTMFSVGLSCFLVIVLRRGVLGMVESTLIANSASLLLFASFVSVQLKVRTSFQVLRELLKIGIPLVPAFVMIFILQHANKYILQWLEGIATVGIYTIGFNIGLVMSLLVSAFQTAWLPYFMSFKERPDEARILFGRILTYYLFGFGTLSLLFFIFAKLVIMVMTQPPFLEAYTVVGLSAGASFVSGVFFIMLPGIYYAKDVKYVTVIQTISAGIEVALNILLISWYGLFGAAIALFFGFLAMVICIHAWNLRKKDTYIRIVYEWKRILQFSSIYVLFAIVMLWRRDLPLIGEGILSIVASGILAVLMYRLLNREEKNALVLFFKQVRSGKIEAQQA